MSINQRLYVAYRREWRSCLSKNHRSKQGVWLVLQKKLSREPWIEYDEVVNETICYGWIDRQVKRMDEERYLRWPRRQKTDWSRTNKQHVLIMFRERKMTQAGLKSLPTEVIKRGKNTTRMRKHPFGRS